MIVVSDTSPLTALLTVGKAEILSQLFGDVIIPEEVRDELARSHSSLPNWIRVRGFEKPGWSDEIFSNS